MKTYYVLYDLSREAYLDIYRAELSFVNYIDNLSDSQFFLSEEDIYNELIDLKNEYSEIENDFIEIKKIYK